MPVKQRLGPSGFGLVEALMAAGILSAIVLLTVSMLGQSQRVIRGIGKGYIFDTLVASINQIASQPATCAQLVANGTNQLGGTPTAHPLLNLNGVVIGDQPPHSTSYQSGAITVTKLSFGTITAIPGTANTFSVELDLAAGLQGTDTSAPVGTQTRKAAFTLTVQVDAASIITACGIGGAIAPPGSLTSIYTTMVTVGGNHVWTQIPCLAPTDLAIGGGFLAHDSPGGPFLSAPYPANTPTGPLPNSWWVFEDDPTYFDGGYAICVTP